jgi:hypothetical protein
MMSTTTAPTAVPKPSHLDELLALVRLVSDGPAAIKKLEDLRAAAADAKAAIEAAKSARVTFLRERAGAELALEDKTNAADVEIAKKRTAFDAECEKKRRELEAREAAVGDREAQTRMDADAVAQSKKDVETKLAAIRAAAAS